VIAGLVLAAGAGRRLGRPKAEVLLGGRSLLDRAVQTLADGGCDEVLAVVRSAAVPAAGARLIVNEAADTGMGSSLRLGLAALPAPSTACLITLVDLPDITAQEVGTVIERFRSGARIVAVRRAGARSHPVLVADPLLAELAAAARGDQGGRAFFAAHQRDTTFLDYPDPIDDIDTPAQLRAAEIRFPG
jgi:CTP:molybdopterin cytidylyltransferase MocA